MRDHGRPNHRKPHSPRVVPPHVDTAKAVRAQARLEKRRLADDPDGPTPPLFRTTLGGEIPWSRDRYVLVDAGTHEVLYGPVDALAPVAKLWEPVRTFMRAIDAEGRQRRLSKAEQRDAVAVKAEHDEEAA